MMPPHPTRRWDAPCPPPLPGEEKEIFFIIFPAFSAVFGRCPGAVRPRSMLCSFSRVWEKRIPGAGEHGGGGGGERERDLTAATAHFTACHALMAQEIKAGMELFIEINQSPRRRGENNIASSVIPGLRAAGRMSQKAPPGAGPARFCDGHCQKTA